MKTPLAIYNLWHQGAKTLVSVCGVAFALLLVFMQLGFMGAVSHTATNVLESLKFDILIRARDYLHLYEPGQIDRQWLTIAKGTEGVEAASPFWVTIQNWRKLPTSAEIERGEFENQYLPIAVMAFEADSCVFKLPSIQNYVNDRVLASDRVILMDDSTQANYGPLENQRFSDADLTRETEIGGQAFTIQGHFKLGTGLASNGAVVTSSLGFGRITPWDIRSTASMGLVQVAGNESQKLAILEELRRRLALPTQPDSASPQVVTQSSFLNWFSASEALPETGMVSVLTRSEVLEREKKRWLWQTPIGLIFQLGVVLSLLVGAAIVYMVLSTDVANRLPEYATLLAIGYSRSYLATIVMTQAIVLSLLGFLAAWGAAEILYRVTSVFSNIPLIMEPSRVVAVCLLGLVMCCFSGLLALRKLWKAEPASLF